MIRIYEPMTPLNYYGPTLSKLIILNSKNELLSIDTTNETTDEIPNNLKIKDITQLNVCQGDGGILIYLDNKDHLNHVRINNIR